MRIEQYRNDVERPEIVLGVCRVKPLGRIYHSDLEAPSGIGFNAQVGPDVTAGKYFSMGEDSYIARAVVGRFTAFGSRNAINPFQHPTDWLSIHEFQYHPDPDAYDWHPEWRSIQKLPRSKLLKHCRIGNDVWTGHNVTVMGDVTIGDGAIVAANAVVTHDVPPYAIVAGVPAKLIRYRFSEQIIARLSRLAWWNLPIEALNGLPFDNIEECLDRLEEVRSKENYLKK